MSPHKAVQCDFLATVGLLVLIIRWFFQIRDRPESRNVLMRKLREPDMGWGVESLQIMQRRHRPDVLILVIRLMQVHQ